MNTQLAALGWDDFFQQSFESINDGNLIPVRIIRENRGEYIVNSGSEQFAVRSSGAVRDRLSESGSVPTVGDWLAVERVKATGESLARHRLSRKSRFERQVVGKKSAYQTVAANFDTLFLVSGLDGDFNPRRIQRYLSLACNSGARPVVVLNKADLVPYLELIVEEVQKIALDAPVLTISALQPETLDCLGEYLSFGKTVALFGSSGVGKSSMVNGLLREERLASQAVRREDSKGRHTTTWRELIQLPGRGMIIDLPGMRELQLTEDTAGISKSFGDVLELATQCRFRNCSHNGEPGCAVEAAITAGELEQDRFEQFMRQQQESAYVKERRASRKKPASKTQQEREQKDDYFKEIHIQLRKHAKEQKKFLKDD